MNALLMTVALATMPVLACTPAFADAADDGVTIDNFHQVDSVLYRSGRPSADEIAELAPLGIKTVLSLESYMLDPDGAGEERAAAETQGMQFERVEMSPLFTDRPSVAQLEAALAILTDPAKQPVLVHCYHGSDRTGEVVGAYHMRVDHWTAAEAKADMRNFGHSPLYYWWDSVLDDLPPTP